MFWLFCCSLVVCCCEGTEQAAFVPRRQSLGAPNRAPSFHSWARKLCRWLCSLPLARPRARAARSLRHARTLNLYDRESGVWDRSRRIRHLSHRERGRAQNGVHQSIRSYFPRVRFAQIQQCASFSANQACFVLNKVVAVLTSANRHRTRVVVIKPFVTLMTTSVLCMWTPCVHKHRAALLTMPAVPLSLCPCCGAAGVLCTACVARC